MQYQKGELVPTRLAYGQALAEIGADKRIVVLDAETENSTYSELFKKAYPDRFFEMFIAEQNMVGAALGLSKCHKIPFLSSFAAFLTRAFDQFRMAGYSEPNLKVCGSHCGVSIGEDGTSQMGVEDLAMFKTIPGSTVLYPADAVSTNKLVKIMLRHRGLDYLRTTRMPTPIIYPKRERFPIGGSKTVISSSSDRVTVVAAGVTLHEAIKAAAKLKQKKINLRVIDCYSVKPIDAAALKKAIKAVGPLVITVEDHRPEGGLGDSVLSALAAEKVHLVKLASGKICGSGKPEQLLKFEGIDSSAICRQVQLLLPAGHRARPKFPPAV
jgi:transketolase